MKQTLLEEYEESRNHHQQHLSMRKRAEIEHSGEFKELFARTPRLSNTIGSDLLMICTDACKGRVCVGPPCGAIMRNGKRSAFPQGSNGLKQFCEHACQGRNCFGPPCYMSDTKQKNKKSAFPQGSNGLKQFCDHACQGRNCFRSEESSYGKECRLKF